MKIALVFRELFIVSQIYRWHFCRFFVILLFQHTILLVCKHEFICLYYGTVAMVFWLCMENF